MLRSPLLDDSLVLKALREAWQDSHPGVSGGHEEGGFILQDANAELSVVRWPRGAQNSIALPNYANGKVNELDIVATFHTHPNSGSDYLQEPSETDKRAVRDDADLRSPFYEGEFVIAAHQIYLIAPDGQVQVMGNTHEILKLGRS